MIIHYHYSPNPNSGEIRRIRNINNEFCIATNSQCIEIEFYSFRDRKHIKSDWKFKLTKHISKKYYFPLFPFSGRFRFIQWISDFCTSIILLLMYLKHRPEFIIGEYSISYSAMLLNRFIGCKYIVDMHGAIPEEYEYNNTSIICWKQKYLTLMEAKTSKNANFIICQSEEMKRHIAKKYAVDETKIFVYKCGVDTNLFKFENEKKNLVRSKLGISNDCFVFIYAGGLMKWQKIEESLIIYSEAHKIIENCKFIILTHETEKIEAILKNLHLEYLSNDIIAMSSPFDKVSDFLNTADVAFLLRDDVIMNRVASPTKLAEYMACGLPVLTSKVASYWVNDSAIRDNSIIFYEDIHDYKEFVNMVSNINRDAIRLYSMEKLSLAIDANNIRNLIAQLD